MNAFHQHIADTLFKGSLPNWQKAPVDALVAEGLRRDQAIERIAYVLATAFHETGRFKHREEIGQGQGRPYGQPIAIMSGKTVTYHGRGFVQLTWLQNYAKMCVVVERDIVNNPDLVMEDDVASLVIWEGMMSGTFTGKNLADYIGPGGVDYVGARRIVNGTDKDDLIAGYAREFEAGLRKADGELVAPSCPVANCPNKVAA